MPPCRGGTCASPSPAPASWAGASCASCPSTPVSGCACVHARARVDDLRVHVCGCMSGPELGAEPCSVKLARRNQRSVHTTNEVSIWETAVKTAWYDPRMPACAPAPFFHIFCLPTRWLSAGMRPIVNMGGPCRLKLRGARRSRRSYAKPPPQRLYFKSVNASLQDALHVRAHAHMHTSSREGRVHM